LSNGFYTPFVFPLQRNGNASAAQIACFGIGLKEAQGSNILFCLVLNLFYGNKAKPNTPCPFGRRLE
jgi:hypothetical protein